MAYKKYFTMSYDDAHPNDRRFVEILNYYGIKCTFNINSCMLPQHFNPEDRVSYDEMRELYKGHEVAAHGAHHGRYNLMSKEEIYHDIVDDINTLSDAIGYRVKGFAYPYGTYDDYCVDILRQNGIVYSRTVNSLGGFEVPKKPLEATPTCHHSWELLPQRIEELIHAEPTEDDMLLYVWGHSFEFSFNEDRNSWEWIEKICKMVSGHDDINYVTNLQFFERNNSFSK